MNKTQIVITSWLFLLITLVAVILFEIIYYILKKQKNIKYEKKYIIKPIFYYYICIIISFTLLPVSIPAIVDYELEFNFNPIELVSAFTNRAALISYAENVLLFMPLTILGYLGEIKIFKNFFGATICSALISITIEILQGIEVYLKILEDFIPIIDINDVICNTIGGILGFLIIRFYKKEHK